MNEHGRIGFISTRLAGTDGVSLEARKWVDILQGLGHECFFFAGECDHPAERSYVVPEAHFKHPAMESLTETLFGRRSRSLQTSQVIEAYKSHLKSHLYEFLRRFEINLLIVENALALPVNVPLGLALTELIAETGTPTIAHHHDFSWERKRYLLSAAEDYLRMAFPPNLPSIHHVVINSFAARQLALRTGAGALLIPNVMDFDAPAPEADGFAAHLRAEFEIRPDDYLLLQPTRVVPRKRIEHAIELCRRLDRERCVLVVSHASGDEGNAYQNYLKEYADLMGVRVFFSADRIRHARGQAGDGKPIFSLADVYLQAQLVTYPSAVEGFGNAFLETIYYHRPIVMSTYEIFLTDIAPKGFRVVAFDQFIQEDTVAQARWILENPGDAQTIAEHNFALGRRYFSFRTLEVSLVSLISRCLGA
jgi:glycosyltransferase involved in cell wall biosynthesis